MGEAQTSSSRTSTVSFGRKLDFLLRLARSEALSVRSMLANAGRVHQPLINGRPTLVHLFPLTRNVNFPSLPKFFFSLSNKGIFLF